VLKPEAWPAFGIDCNNARRTKRISLPGQSEAAAAFAMNSIPIVALQPIAAETRITAALIDCCICLKPQLTNLTLKPSNDPRGSCKHTIGRFARSIGRLLRFGQPPGTSSLYVLKAAHPQSSAANSSAANCSTLM
jgi:hypothetical protein